MPYRDKDHKIKIVLYQGRLGTGVPFADLRNIIEYKPHFTVFPEYFWIRKGAIDFITAAKGYKSAMEEMTVISKKLPGYLIGGTLIEADNGRFFNTCHILRDGSVIGKYRKINLFGRERDVLTPGDGFMVFNLFGINCGVIICADALQQSSFIEMRRLKAQLIFAPTFSQPNRDDTPEKKLERDKNIYLKGAEVSGATVLKCCSVGELFGRKANGRSLACSRKEFIYRIDDDSEIKTKIIKIELEDL